MYPTTEYEISQEDLDMLLDACKPTPVMFLSGGQPMFNSPQENANHAWKLLGEKYGFVWDSPKPIDGKGMRFFKATPNENETQKAEREEKEKEVEIIKHRAKLDSEIDRLQKERLALG